jgi:MFS transporter, DHA1 family, inner membrane transport protein
MSEAENGDSATAELAPSLESTRLSGREWLLLGVLATVQFTHIVDFMIVMPLGPLFFEDMGLNTQEHHFVVSAYTISAGVAGLLAARLLDRFCRKTALLTLYAGFGLGTLMCALAPNYPLLLAGRGVAGAFGGVAAAVVLAIVGDAFPYSRRGTAMGVIMSSFSIASIAGVPIGLKLANSFGWRVPFAALAVFCLPVLALGIRVLPRLRGHKIAAAAEPVSTWQVIADKNHLRAFAFTAALVFTTFSMAPGMVTYLQYNAGMPADDVPWVYLCGGLTTVVTLTAVGKLADRLGKLRVFRWLALGTIVPIVLVSNLPQNTAVVVALVCTTMFMILSSGRMVPAMALVTASCDPAQRGAFMSLNAAVQHVASGLAASVAGLMMTQDPQTKALDGYFLVGLLGCAASVISVYLVGRMRPAKGGLGAPDSAELASRDELPLDQATGGMQESIGTVSGVETQTAR